MKPIRTITGRRSRLMSLGFWTALAGYLCGAVAVLDVAGAVAIGLPPWAPALAGAALAWLGHRTRWLRRRTHEAMADAPVAVAEPPAVQPPAQSPAAASNPELPAGARGTSATSDASDAGSVGAPRAIQDGAGGGAPAFGYSATELPAVPVANAAARSDILEAAVAAERGGGAPSPAIPEPPAGAHGRIGRIPTRADVPDAGVTASGPADGPAYAEGPSGGPSVERATCSVCHRGEGLHYPSCSRRGPRAVTPVEVPASMRKRVEDGEET